MIDTHWAEKIENITIEWFLGVLMAYKLNVNLYGNIRATHTKNEVKCWRFKNSQGLISVKTTDESMMMWWCVGSGFLRETTT